MASWLKNAVFYEVYPQSFYDGNGDGIGDLPGLCEKLDYIHDMGFTAIWLNPVFDSPFRDAGYDVRDYRKVAPRYGTNDDLMTVFQKAHERHMHVILDLVPGHTSEEHPWFLESRKAERNAFSDRYIWTDSWFHTCPGYLSVGGEAERDGTYLLSFFKCQPALNYGFLHPTESWQTAADAPAALETREAIKDVMRFWLDRGCDGFRVDMADSLVKFDDEKKSGTSAVWQDIRRMLDRDYPEAVLVAEWCRPDLSLKAGFDADFYLDHEGNGYQSLLRDRYNGEDRSFFRRDARNRDIGRFLNEYLPWLQEPGYVALITGNHDTPRMARTLSPREMKLYFAFLMTMPGVPFCYYGDEIGMRYLSLPTKEGGYTRTGSRSPMQWNDGRNCGFSSASPERLYLPVDPAEDAPNAAQQREDPDSLLSCVRKLIQLRRKTSDLQADGGMEVVSAQKDMLAYRRGAYLMAVNPTGHAREMTLEENWKAVFAIGNVEWENGICRLGPQSFGVGKVSGVL
ncbi:MAG: glycosylase [Clostridia bacterium]|nr:glycosylase [Clostridia bacterium]